MVLMRHAAVVFSLSTGGHAGCEWRGEDELWVGSKAEMGVWWGGVGMRVWCVSGGYSSRKRWLSGRVVACVSRSVRGVYAVIRLRTKCRVT